MYFCVCYVYLCVVVNVCVVDVFFVSMCVFVNMHLVLVCVL